MSKLTTRLTGTSRMGTETGTDDVSSRTREEPEDLYEMIVVMINKLISMNKRHNEDCEEKFRTFRKEYGGIARSEKDSII